MCSHFCSTQNWGRVSFLTPNPKRVGKGVCQESLSDIGKCRSLGSITPGTVSILNEAQKVQPWVSVRSGTRGPLREVFSFCCRKLVQGTGFLHPHPSLMPTPSMTLVSHEPFVLSDAPTGHTWRLFTLQSWLAGLTRSAAHTGGSRSRGVGHRGCWKSWTGA